MPSIANTDYACEVCPNNAASNAKRFREIRQVIAEQDHIGAFARDIRP